MHHITVKEQGKYPRFFCLNQFADFAHCDINKVHHQAISVHQNETQLQECEKVLSHLFSFYEKHVKQVHGNTVHKTKVAFIQFNILESQYWYDHLYSSTPPELS